MPVASNPQQDAPIVHYHHLLPKSPVCLTGRGASNIFPNNSTTLMPELGATHVSGRSPSHSLESPSHLISTHSPPILNLSPNLSSPAQLSPTDQQPQRSSQFYDLRESTRRQSIQDVHLNLSQQMQHSPQLLSGLLAAAVEDSERKTESPNRKRRKTSGSIVDLTNSPSPPPVRNWETLPESQRTRRRSATQRRVSGDRARRSPGTRRRTRERNSARTTDSPDRRAFQPPHVMGRQIHPAAVLTSGQQQQQSVLLDVDQIPVTNPVTMAPYAFPVCTAPHHLPCNTNHVPVCNTQSTWSIPCTVHLPSCGVQHFPTCLQQVPLPQSLPPTMLHASHPTPQQMHQQHYTVPPPYYSGRTQQVQESDVPLMNDRHPNYPVPPRLHPNMQLNPSPPIFLQEPTVHPTPHDLYGPYSRYYARRSMSRSRLRPPPPTQYPGFLLHFLAMLNPPVPPYGREHSDEASDVENYEALLNLAERLGEAKPRGLTKADIDQLPAYRFNSETRRTDLDMTSCVVCMCDFENRQLLRVLPCSHEFHGKCVDKWLKTNRTCPICRADASEVGSQSE